ncbi:MAG: T9SS C-terminal target domain-containing protein [Bacteroidetes bacterium]|nr:MAG: T9SS C-terminal target domain-containing protein [Bacteroidota bacterium]
MFFLGLDSFSAVSITVPTVSGMCNKSGFYSNIGNIEIDENLGYDFGGVVGPFSSVFSFNAPSGFEFKANTGNVLRAGTEITNAVISITSGIVYVSVIGTNLMLSGLDGITISGLKIKSESNAFENTSIFKSAEFGDAIAGFGLGSQLARLQSVVSGNIAGWQTEVCRNAPIYSIDLFPTGGTVSMNNICSNTSSYTFTGSKLFINPLCFSTGVNDIQLTYTFPISINGCNQMYREADNNSNISLGFNNLIDFSHPYTNTQGVELLPSFNLMGHTFSFSGEGVSGKYFYPNAVAGPYPPKIINLNIHTINNVTGCTGIQSRAFTVYDPSSILNFNPVPPLLQEVSTLIGWFCINDFQQYSISLNTLTGILQPSQFYPTSLLGRGVSITAPTPLFTTVSGGDFGLNYGVTTAPGLGYGNANNFRFSPSLITVTTTSYPLYLMADTLTNGALPRGQPFSYLNTKQEVNIAQAISKLSRDVPLIQSFCLGNVDNTAELKVKNNVSGAIIKWYRVTGTGINAKILTTTTVGVSVLVTTLGVTNASPVGVYTFCGTQKRIAGCESDTINFIIRIKSVPTVPGIISAQTTFCSDTTYSVSFSPSTTVVGYTYNWHNLFPTAAGINIYSSNTISDVVTVNSSAIYYLTTFADGCSSNEFISTLLGANPTVRSASLNFIARPLLPTVVGFNNYCLGDIINPVTVQGVFTSQVNFRWYTATTTGGATASTITGTVSTLPGIFHKGVFSTSVSSAIPINNTFYLKAIDLASSCKSVNYLPITVSVFQIPEPPSVFKDDMSGFLLATDTILNQKPYCYDLSPNTVIGIRLSSFETSPIYYLTTITSTVNSVFSTGMYKSVPGVNVYNIGQIANGCKSLTRKINVIVNDIVTPPFITIAGLNYSCTGFSMPDLIASTTIPSGFINWFSSVTGTVLNASISGTNPTKSFNPLSRGFITNTVSGLYYFLADVTDKDLCVSNKNIISFEYRNTPIRPNTYDTAYCAGTVTHGLVRADALILPNQDFEWSYNTSILGINQISTTTGNTRYQEALSTSFLGANFPENNTSYTLSVRQNVNGCFSTSRNLNVLLRTNPAIPTNIPLAIGKEKICVGNKLPVLVAQSGLRNLKWYNSSTLSTIIATTTSYNTAETITATSAPIWTYNTSVASPMIFYFYNTQTIHDGLVVNPNFTFAGCTSLPRKDSVIYYPIPPKPNLVSLTGICVGLPITPLIVSGASMGGPLYRWYIGTTLGVGVSSGSSYRPSINNLTANVSFYSASQTHYIQTGFTGCESPLATNEYVIKPLPNLSITTSKPITNNQISFCSTEPIATFLGSSLGGNFSSTFSGFTNVGSTCTFDPTITFLGFNNTSAIDYTYTELTTGCTDSKKVTIQINKIPGNMSLIIKDATSTSLTGYCATQNESYPLVLNNNQNINGTALVTIYNNSNNYVSSIAGNFLPFDLFQNPAIRNSLDAAQIRLQYKYTLNSSGCSDSISFTKMLYANPTISFLEDSKCEQIPITLISTLTGFLQPASTVIGSAINYKWTGNEISASNPTVSLAGYNGLFSPGTKSIQLKVTTQFGCQNTNTRLVRVGPTPNAILNITDICQNDSTRIIDKSTIANGKIFERTIDFGDTQTYYYINNINGISNESITGHLYNSLGNKLVTMTVVSDLGCIGTTSGNTFILEKINLVSSNGHFQDFSNPTQAAWFSDSKIGKESLNTWTYGIPNKPFMNASGINQSWYVNTLGGKSYPVSQKSYLNSPCFDFTGFKKPMINLDLFVNTRSGADGAVLQYSVDGAKSWISLGGLGNGINWYNSESILSLPSDNPNAPQGWSGLINESKKAFSVRHTLDAIRDSSKVRFRLAFSSADATILSDSTYEGIAIDNFKINQRSKITLIEHFENESSTESKYATRGANGDLFGYGLIGVDSIINSAPDNIVAIKYHTAFPKEDAFNLQNPSDVSVRVLDYEVNNVPYTILDGNVFAANTFANRNTTLEDSLKRLASLQTLLSPDFDLTMNVSTSTNMVSVTVLSRINYTSTSPLVLQVAQIERVVRKNGVNGQTKFESVLRYLIPNPAGTVFNQTWSIGQSKVVSLPYNTNLISNQAMLGFVGFIQNSSTKSVLQAVYNGPNNTNLPLPTSLQSIENQSNLVEIYPNPAQNQVKIKAENQVKKIIISDIAGKKIMQLENQKNTELSINTSDFENGLYYLLIYFDGNYNITKKLIIAK